MCIYTYICCYHLSVPKIGNPKHALGVRFQKIQKLYLFWQVILLAADGEVPRARAESSLTRLFRAFLTLKNAVSNGVNKEKCAFFETRGHPWAPVATRERPRLLAPDVARRAFRVQWCVSRARWPIAAFVGSVCRYFI